MTDLTYLSGLIDLLKSKGVTHYSEGSLTLNFGAQYSAPIIGQPAQVSQWQPQQYQPAQEQVPQVADDLMSHDEALFWSASPEAKDKPSMPLTGDKPIDE